MHNYRFLSILPEFGRCHDIACSSINAGDWQYATYLPVVQSIDKMVGAGAGVCDGDGVCVSTTG